MEGRRAYLLFQPSQSRSLLLLVRLSGEERREEPVQRWVLFESVASKKGSPPTHLKNVGCPKGRRARFRLRDTLGGPPTQ